MCALRARQASWKQVNCERFLWNVHFFFFNQVMDINRDRKIKERGDLHDRLLHQSQDLGRKGERLEPHKHWQGLTSGEKKCAPNIRQTTQKQTNKMPWAYINKHSLLFLCHLVESTVREFASNCHEHLAPKCFKSVFFDEKKSSCYLYKRDVSIASRHRRECMFYIWKHTLQI